jgi:hypothetical protein
MRLPWEPSASIQPSVLCSAIGFTEQQVGTSLRAAIKRGDIESIEDGSVRLTSQARDQLKAGKPSGALALPDWLAVPLAIINRAISVVPAVKYALGVAGVGAGAAIIYGLLTNLQNPWVWALAGIVTLAMILFMVLLFVFAKLVELGGPAVQLAGLVFMWFVLVLTMCTCSLAFTSFFSQWRMALPQALTVFL